MATNNDAQTGDFLGGTGRTLTPGGNVQKAAGRPTTLDGLVYTDTGEYTPLYYARIKATQNAPGYENWVDPMPGPTRTQIDSGEAKYDEKTGLYYTEDRGIKKVMASPDEAARRAAEQPVPIFTVAKQPSGAISKAAGAAQGAAGGALAGSALGPAGVVGGAALGAIASTRASGTPLQLGAGNGTVTGPGIYQGTAAQAAQGNANIAAGARTSTPAGGFQPPQQTALRTPLSGGPMATYTPGAGTNGGSALSQEANRIVQQANQMAQAGNQRAQTYFDQAAAASNRAAPQMAMPSSANQQAVYDRAMGFQADISGAQRLENMQMDMQGINNLESWSPQYSMQGVQNLESFNPSNTINSMNILNSYSPEYAAAALPGLENFRADGALQGASNLERFDPSATRQGYENLERYTPTESRAASDMLVEQYYQAGANAIPAAQKLAEFQASREGIEAMQGFEPDRSSVDRLNAYADQAEGPSAAQAMLRAQADADKRTQIAIARSGRGGAAGQAQAMRQAMSEGAAIMGDTRGQAGVLRAQETNAYENRRLTAMSAAGQLNSAADQQKLAALAHAGSLISEGEAQRLAALQASGQILSNVDAQKLSAAQSFAQLRSTMDSQSLQALLGAGELRANADNQRLTATSNAGQLRAAADQMSLAGKQTAGQMRTNMDQQVLGARTAAGGLASSADGQILNARTNAAQLRSTMDAQGLSAIGQAAGLRTQQDSIRSNNLQAAGNIRIQGSGQNLQALSLAGQVASDIRNQDINVLRSNLDASLQTMGLNDNQVRFFSQLGNDRENASNNLQMSGAALGLTAQQLQQAQSALDLQWEQFGFSQLTNQQQLQLQYDQMAQQGAQFNTQSAMNQQQINNQQSALNYQQGRQTRNDIFQGLGSAFTAISSLFPTSQASSASSVIAPVMGLGPMNMNGQSTVPPVGTGGGQVFDPFTNQWVYPNQAA